MPRDLDLDLLIHPLPTYQISLGSDVKSEKLLEDGWMYVWTNTCMDGWTDIEAGFIRSTRSSQTKNTVKHIKNQIINVFTTTLMSSSFLCYIYLLEASVDNSSYQRRQKRTRSYSNPKLYQTAHVENGYYYIRLQVTGRLLNTAHLIIFLHCSLRQLYNLTLGWSNSEVTTYTVNSHFAIILQNT